MCNPGGGWADKGNKSPPQEMGWDAGVWWRAEESARIGGSIGDAMQRRGAEEMARWNRRAEGGGGMAKAQSMCLYSSENLWDL